MKLKLICAILFISLALMGCSNMENVDIPIYEEGPLEISNGASTQIVEEEQNDPIASPSPNEDDADESVEETPAQSVQNTQNVPDRAPLLYLSIMPDQRIQTIRRVAGWVAQDENGEPIGFSPIASFGRAYDLEPSRFDDVTLHIDDANNVIMLEFSINYPPQSLSVVRWNVKYLEGGYDDSYVWDKRESIEVTGNTIHIANDGYDYIYDISAAWSEELFFGNAVYSFRTVSGDTN